MRIKKLKEALWLCCDPAHRVCLLCPYYNDTNCWERLCKDMIKILEKVEKIDEED